MKRKINYVTVSTNNEGSFLYFHLNDEEFLNSSKIPYKIHVEKEGFVFITKVSAITSGKTTKFMYEQKGSYRAVTTFNLPIGKYELEKEDEDLYVFDLNKNLSYGT